MKLLNIMVLLSIKPRGFEENNHFTCRLSFVCYEPDTRKYKPAYKKTGSFLKKYL